MKKIAVGFILSFAICSTAQAQGQAGSEQLAKVRQLLVDRITTEMPGWLNRSIQPITGSESVMIQHWELGNIAVKIAVTLCSTEGKAAQALKDFRAQMKIEEQATLTNRGRQLHLIKEDLQLGDEGFAWDIRGAEAVSFRKGTFLVDVSIARPEESNDTHFSKLFARHVASVLALQ